MLEANIHDLISEIEDMCECSICCDKYNDKRRTPRVLPCQHTFCTNCLSKQCRRRALKCPLCNHEHYIENGNVDTLPKDYTRIDLNGLLENYFGHICKQCTNIFYVQYFCKMCNVQMCHVCYGLRKNGRCRTHEIEKQEITSTSKTLSTYTVNTPSDNICYLTGHEMNELKYFCSEQSCCIPICANCVVDTHKGHTCKTVADEYNECKKLLLRSCQETRNKITNAKSLLKTIRQNNVTWNNKARMLEKQALRDFENEAKKIVTERSQIYLRMLGKREENVQTFIKRSTECCVISEKALSGESMIAFLSVEKTLSEKLKSFLQSDVDMPLIPIPPDIELHTPTLELEGKIDLMTSADGETIEKLNFLKGAMKFFSEKTPIRIIHDSFRMPVFLCLVLLLGSWVLFSHNCVSYSVFHTDNTYLKLRKSKWFQLCISTDRKMFSNVPMENMRQTCGSTQTPFIFRGAFTNTSFDNENGKGLYFDIDVSGIQKHSPGLILFEFGVKKDPRGKQNYPSILSNDFFGWMLTVINPTEVALISTGGRIVDSAIPIFDKTSFYYVVEIDSNNTMSLKTKDKDEVPYTILDETTLIKSNRQVGYAKVCSFSNANVKIKLTKNNISFNRSTLYPNLYIAENNRTISNYPQPSFKKQILTRKHAIQDIMLLNCTLDCVYVLNFRADAPTAKDVFSLVLTNSKNLTATAHVNETLFTYSQCSNFGTYKSFCFVVYRNNRRNFFIEMHPDEWHSIIIMVNRREKSALFMIGNHEIEVKNDHIFERGTPILRFVSLSTDDCVSVYLGARDDFQIHTWIIQKTLIFVRTIFNAIDISTGLIYLYIFANIYLIHLYIASLKRREPIHAVRIARLGW